MNIHSHRGIIPTLQPLEVTLGGRSSKPLQFQDIAIFHSPQIDFAPAKNETRNDMCRYMQSFDLSRSKSLVDFLERSCPASDEILLTWGITPSILQIPNALRIFHSLQVYFAPSQNQLDHSTNQYPTYHRTITSIPGGVA